MNLVGTMLNQHENSKVYELIDQIIDTSEAYLDWKSIMLMLTHLSDSGKTVFSMDSTMKSMVLEIASKTEPTMAVMNAISIMTLVYGMEFNNFTFNTGSESARIASSHLISGFRKKQKTNYIVYPNPSKDHLFIEKIEKHNFSKTKFILSICDITGRTMNTEIKNYVGDSKMEVDVSNLKSGFYFIKIMDDNKATETHKIIIEN